jgi:hypothetical protein
MRETSKRNVSVAGACKGEPGNACAFPITFESNQSRRSEMRTDNMNEQGANQTTQTRNGAAADDKSKGAGGEREAPVADVDPTAVRQKSGVVSDDKSKSFGS